MNHFYSNTIQSFLGEDVDTVLGKITASSDFDVIKAQRDTWIAQIRLLKEALKNKDGAIYFEYSIPRMGRRIDAVVITGNTLYVIEFKVGESAYASYALDQVWDYALDLKNFHSTSHDIYIAPVLVATEAKQTIVTPQFSKQEDKVFQPIAVNAEGVKDIFSLLEKFVDSGKINQRKWEDGIYSPTPTIVEAAMSLYRGHAVESISRSDAGAINLKNTVARVSGVIADSKKNGRKSICFVTGVPGAGKTLVGLDVAQKHLDKDSDLYSVYLSGNGPLVSILREALARDRVAREKEKGNRFTKKDAIREVSLFIQNVHHFRDDCLRGQKAPIEHVALFDEAQRAWDKKQTVDFMRRKKGQQDFNLSEPEFLISCMDRHNDWATVVCLVGGGQEIHTGEGGIKEWINCLNGSFPEWEIYVSPRLTDSEYGSGEIIEKIKNQKNVHFIDELHLAVSMRSFRAENVSKLVKEVLDIRPLQASKTLEGLHEKYPIVITRDIKMAKDWIKTHARGSERYGMIVSSQAERLRPHAIFVKSTVDPVHWFLDGKDDVRSSYYMEDVATEFDIQGLELDWSCVVWDGDFRYTGDAWGHYSFVGSRWQNIKKEERQTYQKNAYRVLLTRARQGMVIVVPNGDANDSTRSPEFYDETYGYLKSIGFKEI